MKKQKLPEVEVKLENIVGGGQTIANMADGLKLFVWGGLPGEQVKVQLTKKKSKLAQGIVTEVLKKSSMRVEPRDPESYLSTSPWQIMKFESERHYKAALIEEAFELDDIVLPEPIDIYTDGVEYHYRNKVEFSWYGTSASQRAEQHSPSETSAAPSHADECSADDGREALSLVDGGQASDKSEETLDLAFFRRGTKGKIVVDDSALLPESIVKLAREIRDFLSRKHVQARDLKTLIIRSNQKGDAVWQLYIKTPKCNYMTIEEAKHFSAQGGEVIYSDPKSPASRITERLLSAGNTTLTDEILGTEFSYNAESFFQVNIPVYEQALKDMQEWVGMGVGGWELGVGKTAQTSAAAQPSHAEGSAFPAELDQDQSVTSESSVPEVSDGRAVSGPPTPKVVDMYAGVGTIGLTIGGDKCTLVEINESAVNEMRQNIGRLGKSDSVNAVLAPSEKALEYITSDATIIVDPPRAGLHKDVITRMLEVAPPRIIYLSCNPVTQARDVEQLAAKYGIRYHRGYNFFPRTPHLEHLVVLDRKN